MRTQVQAAGYAYMMHSRWKLISNFQQTYNLAEELIKTKLLAREVSRQTPSLIYEDECGTHVFTSYALNLIEYLPDLYAYGVDVVRVDSFLHDDDWTTQTTKVFLEALQHIDDRVYLQKLISQLPSDNYSHGFYLMRKEDLVYLKDEAGAYE
jgi:collagenase-like PrtC family protease